MGFRSANRKSFVNRRRFHLLLFPLSVEIIAALSLSLCSMPTLWAQTGKGAVSGRAVDSGGGVLQGARIELQPGGVTTASNNQGEFTFNDVMPGAYRVLVTFVGFTRFTGDVTVTAGQTSRVDASLAVASENEQVWLRRSACMGKRSPSIGSARRRMFFRFCRPR
jgi:hypothetical protein